MTPRPAPIGPDISTPEKCRAAAAEQDRLAHERAIAGDRLGRVRAEDRARDLERLARQLEADEQKEQA